MTTIDIPYGPHVPDPLAEGGGRSVATRIDAAATSFESAKARLYRSDGSPIFAPEEHAEHMAALLATFDQAAQPLYESAERDEVAGRETIAEGRRPGARQQPSGVRRGGVRRPLDWSTPAPPPRRPGDQRAAGAGALGPVRRQALRCPARTGRHSTAGGPHDGRRITRLPGRAPAAAGRRC